jgi:hypothetical protein
MKGYNILKKDININTYYKYINYKGSNSQKNTIAIILKEWVKSILIN